MPRRNDIAKILVIGSGPIVIGQSAEFDYSGTQACKALKAEGYEVVLVNSNPASIMTDPEVADRTYIEPLNTAYLEEILRIEKEMLDPPQVMINFCLRYPIEYARRELWDFFGAASSYTGRFRKEVSTNYFAETYMKLLTIVESAYAIAGHFPTED